MSETLLLEVDKNDKPTGRKMTKEEAHGEKPYFQGGALEIGLVHRCVAVFVFDTAGQLYVQVHKKSNGMLDHSVGGHVDGEETYLEAAMREMEEEIGLTGVELKEVATGVYSHERRYIHMFGIFECNAPKNWTFISNDEVDEIYPMKLEEIVRQMNKTPEKYTGGFINCMKKYIEVKAIDLSITVEL